jgi:hypothetical protein
MDTIEAKIEAVKAQMTDAKQKGDEKKLKSLKVTHGTLQIQKHAGTHPKPKQPLGPTRKLVFADQVLSTEFLVVWNSRLTNPKFCKESREASGRQKGNGQERDDALGAFCSLIGINLSPSEGRSVEEHQALARYNSRLAKYVMHLGELMDRMNELLQRHAVGAPIDEGHQKKLKDCMKFVLNGQCAQIALDLVSQFPTMLPFFIVIANNIADEEAAEAAVLAQQKQAKADAKAAAFGGGGAAVPNFEQVQSFLNGPAVARGGGAARGGGGAAAVVGGKPPIQRHVVCVLDGTDVSMVPRPTVTLATISGLCLFYNEAQEAIAQQAARMLGTVLLEGAARERANYLAHQSYLTAVAKGKKREQ